MRAGAIRREPRKHEADEAVASTLCIVKKVLLPTPFACKLHEIIGELGP
jgi:hypothetical protein